MVDRNIYIVTGGCGFIGANLVAELVRREPDADVRVIDDMRTGSFINLVEACDRAGVGPFRGVVIPESYAELHWRSSLEDIRPRAVFHLGAITDTTVADEREMLRINSDPFEEMAEAAAATGVPMVYASSAATYGSPPHADRHEPFPLDAAGKPNNVYGFSKWLMEVTADRVQRRRVDAGQPPAHLVGLRFFNVFGPGEGAKGHMASMAYQLANQLLSGKRPRLFEFGDQARDQVPVGDVVDCTIAAAGLGEQPDIVPGVYNLGSGRVTSFNAVLAALREALGISEDDRPTEYFPMPEAVRAFYQDYTCADMSETQRGLGWSPRLDPVEQVRVYGEWLASRATATDPVTA